MGIFIAVIFVIAINIIPIGKIILAKYISTFEKIIWFLLSILGIPIGLILDYPFQKALKNSTNQEEINQLINLHRDSSFSGSITLFWAISIFIIFKISYSHRKGLWEENNKNEI
jgi:hypothetical protein